MALPPAFPRAPSFFMAFHGFALGSFPGKQNDVHPSIESAAGLGAVLSNGAVFSIADYRQPSAAEMMLFHEIMDDIGFPGS